MGNEVSKNYGAKSQSALPMFDPLDLVVIKDKTHPLYDERIDLPLDEDMINSIKINGVINPIMVWKMGEKNGKPIMAIVAGRQRVQNLIEANKRLAAEGLPTKNVPATISRISDPKKLIELLVIDNELRQNDDLIVKAQKAKRMLSLGIPLEQVASCFRVVPQSIKNYLMLLDCSPAVQAAVTAGELSNDAAKKLSILSHDQQDKELREMRASGALKGHKANKKLAEATGKPPTTAMSKKQIKTVYDGLVEKLEAFPNDVSYEFGLLLVKSILEDSPLPFCYKMEGISKSEWVKESERRFIIAKNNHNQPSASLIVHETEEVDDEEIEVNDADSSESDDSIDLDEDELEKSEPKQAKASTRPKKSNVVIDLDSDDDNEDIDTSDLSRLVEEEENAKAKPSRGRPRKVG